MTGKSNGGGRPEDRDGTFTPDTLDRTIIALPLFKEMELRPDDPLNVIIDVNLEYAAGRAKAREEVMQLIAGMLAQGDSRGERMHEAKNEHSTQYVFARLRPETIRAIARLQRPKPNGPRPPIYKIWLDHVVHRFTNKSVSTVKADAARNAFGALGHDIVWAVVDSGVDTEHPHFKKYDNCSLRPPLLHRDFTDESDGSAALDKSAARDANGHGTHVAGIIAGDYESSAKGKIRATVRRRDENDNVQEDADTTITRMTGMAPQCKLLSLKVLDDQGHGLTSNIIAALEYIQHLNSNGRRLLVHGVNLSVGYDYEPKWFACGQSPLCVEVDRLVRSGVVVVVAAGNTGYGYNQPAAPGPVGAGLDVTINDPGNAELGITVGATHRDMPHVYGVSYFSSKGPTGDGRLKPDLLAPGEKIISCTSRQSNDCPPTRGIVPYREDSGTSMAAPHVSGVIAAFLSIRREFIGRPERVKEIFLSTATDLGRARYFQGRGLVDLMRAIQSV